MATTFRCKKFPKDHKEFTVLATEHHTWVVNEEGHFLKDLEATDCEADNSYADCLICGEPAENVRE